MSGKDLLVRRTDGLLHLTIDRPAVRNALSTDLLDRLASSIVQHGPSARAVLIDAVPGKAFSSGFDLSELDSSEGAGKRAGQAIAGAVTAITDCPAPVVAALHGYCLGAAVELALGCDVRVASTDLVMAVPAVQLGLVYRPELLQRLRNLCGHGRAVDLMLTGRKANSDTALQWGLVTEVVADDQLPARALAIAWRLAEAPQAALRGTKRAFELLNREPPSQAVAEEIDALRAAAAADPERADALASVRRKAPQSSKKV